MSMVKGIRSSQALITKLYSHTCTLLEYFQQFQLLFNTDIFLIIEDYRVALLFSFFVLIPLAGLKIIGMVRKLQKMSSRENDKKDELTPKQKEFIQFLEKASNQSKN